ncbi:MAG: TadE/TadG family type IV pilus assembly protein, partial [Planctomycetaceae bacterium]
MRLSDRRRGGVVILESLAVLVILVMGLLAVIQWSLLMMTHAGVTAAAAEGARVAARAVFDSSQQVDTEAAVLQILAAHGVGLPQTVVVTDLGSAVQVTVTVPMTSTGVSDLLGGFVFTLSGNSLQVSSTA